jgi:hypothetical protein
MILPLPMAADADTSNSTLKAIANMILITCLLIPQSSAILKFLRNVNTKIV